MRTVPEVTTYIFRIRQFNARWGQSTAYARPASDSRNGRNRTRKVAAAATFILAISVAVADQKPQTLSDRGREPERRSTICSPPLQAELP